MLVAGRGRGYPALTVAIGERMGLIGALASISGARYLNARDIDGIVIGDGFRSLGRRLPHRAAEDTRLRDLPVAVPATADEPSSCRISSARATRKCCCAHRAVRAHAGLRGALKRLLHSIECKGMLDARTGLLNANAFGAGARAAIEDAAERGARLSLARFSFDDRSTAAPAWTPRA